MRYSSKALPEKDRAGDGKKRNNNYGFPSFAYLQHILDSRNESKESQKCGICQSFLVSGGTMPKIGTTKEKICITIDKELLPKLHKYAEADHRSLSQFINYSLHKVVAEAEEDED